MSARVLVVDDILPNVKLLQAKLANEYYDVLTAMSGEEALDKAVRESPDIILLDVMMPGMDGFEVCKTIKSNPAIAHIPVVMVTALTDSIDRVKGLESGADDFLSKPLNDIALMARVRSLVRLKMTVDEWRVRENTANQLGVSNETMSAMNEPVENAKILVVEDQDFEHKNFFETLSEDHEVVDVVGTEQGVSDKTYRGEYDLIIVSLNLKEDDGLRMCSQLRSTESTRGVPILMVSTEEDMPRIAHGLEMGVHDYILRPVDRQELKARVRTQIRRKRFQERLRSNYEVNLSMALTDSLTGLYNRRYLEVHLQKLLQKNRSSKKDLAVLMFDIDHFKNINDTYGHAVGDEVLQIFAQRLQDNLRSFDMVARFGGEEFVAILPDITKEMTYYVAERLRISVANTEFNCPSSEEPLKITTSIGGVFVGHGEHVPDEIIKRADKALYDAKGSGRNCAVFEGVGKLDPQDYVQEPRPFIDFGKA